jgi:hypothetical protein
VLRRIIRRAVRHGYKLGIQEPFFYKLVAVLEAQMGEAYPELTRGREHAERVLKQEEMRFAETLANGMVLLEGAIRSLHGVKVIDGDTVFKLYDTFGFPADLTADVARERGLSIDDKRVIARGCKWLGKIAENVFAVVMNFAGLAVKEFWSANDFSSKGCADGLMAEANAQDRKSSGEPLDQLHGNACLLRGTWARRNDDFFGLALGNFLYRDFVVAMHFHLTAQLTEILGEVVCEGVVVIKQQYHVFGCLCPTLSKLRSLPFSMRSF